MNLLNRFLLKNTVRLERHPCFSETAHSRYGRVHLPVAGECNIGCKYCLRALNINEDRPGVAERIISPAEALEKVNEARGKYCITVAGIAGPGESLANEETFETFRLMDKYHPDLMKCLSTNGLLLPDKIGILKDLKVRTITVTVNTLDAQVGGEIYGFVGFSGKIYKGVEGAALLIERQKDGVKKAVRAGFTVKINTVLIPEINKGQVSVIAKEYSALGARIMNIIPLIPVSQMKGRTPPTCEELQDARAACEPFISQFKKCRQCRADACGIPGLEEKKTAVNTEYFHA
ncbi:MAG: radical SAM protein [Candidatus Omnitrophota bacterium]|jgi:nitrogen fixation protein NifB